jgi:murein DD-endopeptidase MepM/ murein hydrolase activator NlpD
MQKDDRFYTFLFTHSSRSKIYIRRIEVSKKWLHTCAASAVLSLGLATAGLGIAMNSDKIQSVSAQQLESPALAQFSPVQPLQTKDDVKTINYERPMIATSLNTGGPSSPFQLTNVGTMGEENELETQLSSIERTSNPEFLPTMWAHMGKINNEFGFRRNPFGGRSYEFHPGLDIDGEKGDLIVAPANGVISKAGWQGGYGNLIEIDHGNGLKTRYGHLSKIDVQVGDSVQKSQPIGLIGSTGRSTGPHLHYELRLNDKAVNPRRFLPPEMPN